MDCHWRNLSEPRYPLIIVEEPFDWLSVSETKAQQALGELAKHAEQIKKHAASVLNRVANAAKQAGVSCDTIQVENEQPYKAIIAAAADGGCDLIVVASRGRSRLWQLCAERDKQGIDHTKPRTALSLNTRWLAWRPLWVISRHLQRKSHVRFTPNSGHCGATRMSALAKSGHQRTSSEAVLLVFRGQCCKPFNASAMALSRLGWRSVAASMTARNGLSFSEITLRRVALVVIVNPRLKRLVTCVCRAAAAPAHRFSQARHRYKTRARRHSPDTKRM